MLQVTSVVSEEGWLWLLGQRVAEEATTATDQTVLHNFRKHQVSYVIFFSLATTSDAIAESSLALHNDLDTDMLAIHACRRFDH